MPPNLASAAPSAPGPRPARRGVVAALLAASLGVHAAGLLLVFHQGERSGPPAEPVRVVLSSRWLSGAGAPVPVPAPAPATTDQPAPSDTAMRAKPDPVPVPVPRAVAQRTVAPAVPAAATAARGEPSAAPPAAAPSSLPVPAPPAAEPAPLFPPLPAAPAYLMAANLDERPVLQSDVQLQYPDEADRQQGVVELRLLINERGEVDNVGVVRAFPPGLFEQAAIAAFARASFLPGKRAGVPVKSQLVFAVDFTPFNRGAVSGQGY